MALHDQAAKASAAQVASVHTGKGVMASTGMGPVLAQKLATDRASEDAAKATVRNDPGAPALNRSAARKQAALGHGTMAQYHKEQAQTDPDGDNC